MTSIKHQNNNRASGGYTRDFNRNHGSGAAAEPSACLFNNPHAKERASTSIDILVLHAELAGVSRPRIPEASHPALKLSFNRPDQDLSRPGLSRRNKKICQDSAAVLRIFPCKISSKKLKNKFKTNSKKSQVDEFRTRSNPCLQVELLALTVQLACTFPVAVELHGHRQTKFRKCKYKLSRTHIDGTHYDTHTHTYTHTHAHTHTRTRTRTHTHTHTHTHKHQHRNTYTTPSES